MLGGRGGWFDQKLIVDKELCFGNSAGLGAYLSYLNGNNPYTDCIDSWSDIQGEGALPAGTLNHTLRYNGTAWESSGLMKNDGSTVSILRNIGDVSSPDGGGNVGVNDGFQLIKKAFAQMTQNNSADLFRAQIGLITPGNGNPAPRGLVVDSTGKTVLNGGLWSVGNTALVGNVQIGLGQIFPSVLKVFAPANFGDSSSQSEVNIFGKLSVQNSSNQILADFNGPGNLNIKSSQNAGAVNIGAGTNVGVPLNVNGNVYAIALPSNQQSSTGAFWVDGSVHACGSKQIQDVPFTSSNGNTQFNLTSGQISQFTLSSYQSGCGGVQPSISSNNLIKSNNSSCSAGSQSYIGIDCQSGPYVNTIPNSNTQAVYELYAMIGNATPNPDGSSNATVTYNLYAKKYNKQTTQVTGSQGNFIGTGATLSSLAGNNNNVCADSNGRLVTCPPVAPVPPPTFSTYKVVGPSVTGNNVTSTAQCQTGDLLVGGGGKCSPANSGTHALEQSEPFMSSREWQVRCKGGGTNSTAVAYAVCLSQ
jgi:hypothetical protein